MTRDQTWHACFPAVLWGILSVAPAHRFVQPPCELGNFHVLLKRAGLVENKGKKVGLLDCTQILLLAALRCAVRVERC